ncbi:uncharacterized protein LOC133306512 [Gastrolobium bilobum]|uniref:uncharacterized protein LOC133306512 n=1 Tax=Gastrolobium bilobum TaxID=150636 RepID=UPI002AB1E014|nr:uncharacterized protein LOC133306512 [Gastrolobium bilobum]
MVNPKEHCKSIISRSGLVLQPVNKKMDEKKAGEKKNEEEVVVEDVVVENDREEEVEEKKKEKEVVVEKSSSPQKLMKWEKKKMAEKQDQPINLSPYAKVPYPQRLKQEIQKQHYARFLDIFKKLQINIPFAEALENMPPYAKFMKDLLIPIAIGDVEVGKALCDLGASINLMPLTVCRALGINTLKDTNLILHLADRSIKRPEGVVEDVLVKVDKFIFPVDFVILDKEEEDTESPLLLVRPFLATARSLIDVEKWKLMLRVNEETVTIDVFEAIKHPADVEDCFRIDIIQDVVEEVKGEEELLLEEDKSKEEMSGEFYQEEPVVEELEKKVDDIPKGAPKVELKELPSTLKYVFLGDDQTYPAIINEF